MQLKHREKLVYVLPFIGDFNNSMLGVLIVLYGVKLALTPVQIGWITSFYGFGYLIFPFFFGKIIDRISRKKSLLIATISITGISAVYIGLIAIGSGPSANIFFIGMIIGQFLRAAGYSFYWPTIEAYLSENSEHSEEAHKKSFARFCMAWAFGSAVGSGLAGIFAEISVLLGFCIVFLIYMCAIIIAWKVIPYSSLKSAHHKQIQQVPIQQSQIQQVPIQQVSIQQVSIQQSSPQQTSTKQKSVKQISAKNILNQPEKNQKNYRFWISSILILGTLLFAIGIKAILSYFPNFAVLPERLGWTDSFTGNILFIFGIGHFLSYLLHKLFPVSFNALIFSSAIIVILFVAMYFAINAWIWAIILFTAGFFIGRTYYISLELLMKFEENEKGAKAGIFESLVGIGNAITPILAGSFAIISLNTPFIFFAGICGLILILMLISLRNIHIYEKSS